MNCTLFAKQHIPLSISYVTLHKENFYHKIADIFTVNLEYFSDIAEDIYDNTFLLQGSTCIYKRNTLLDLYVHVIGYSSVIHIADDFNCEVIFHAFYQATLIPFRVIQFLFTTRMLFWGLY